MPGLRLQERRRIVVLFLGVLSVALLLMTRIGWLQLVRGDRLNQRALGQRLRNIPVQAPRGSILDRHLKPLALSETVYSVYVIPAQVRNPLVVASQIAKITGQNPNDLFAKITQRVAVVWLKRRISPTQANAIRGLGLVGVDLAPESKRNYPYGALAGPVFGIAGIDNQGLEGVELYYDRYLLGHKGSIAIEQDARNQEMPYAIQRYQAPVPGDTLVLSMDRHVQTMAERTLDQVLIDTQAKAASIVIMNPKTGGILAMANRPSFNPNQYGTSTASERRNQVITNDIPPGSTFKPITASAALNSGVVTPTSRFFDPGFVKVNGVTVHCWRSGGHGSIDFSQVVENSCNVGFVDVGLKLGVKAFYKYLQSFGLTKPTGVDLPGEAKPIIPPARYVKPLDLATMAFGQTLAITPIQLTAAISAIADGGVWHKPHTVKEILSPTGQIVKRVGGGGRRILSKKAASEVANMMVQVVSKGTGKNAKVPGYLIGGKTGTAQDVINGRYVQGQYIASFVGFGPYPNPKVVVLLEINRPVGPYYGGQIAAPAVGELMHNLFQYYKIKPTDSASSALVQVPNVVHQNFLTARDALNQAGLRTRIVGNGSEIVGQLPYPGARVKVQDQVLLFTGGAPSPNRVQVPNLLGLDASQAAHLLTSLGLVLSMKGTGKIIQQIPVAGHWATKGDVVQVSGGPYGS